MSAVVSQVPSLLRSLQGLLSPSDFPYASNGTLFRDSQFGRDSLETAEDLLEVRPDVARAVILRLAQLQGRRTNPGIGEEPGKIHHEYRARVVNGRQIGAVSLRIFRQLAKEWHIAETDAELEELPDLVNYFTVDATPRFVRLIAAYVKRYGDEILHERYVSQRPGSEVDTRRELTILESVCAAIDWVADRIEQSELHLLEWCRQTPWEHRFQAWKDGGTSYLHENGTYANYNGPMASIEVQGLAYDALLAADRFLAGQDSQRERCAALATTLQRATLQFFWMPDREYFAMGLDREPGTGGVRQLRLLTSNGAAVLDSHLFETLAPDVRQRYVLPIVRRVFGPEFLTPVGIRCTSLLHRDLQDYPAYQSSFTVWHKETFDVAKGLRCQGFPCLADELDRRLLNTVNLAGPREFVYVLPDNRADYGQVAGRSNAETIEIAATNHPENDQSWTVAAALAIKWRNGRRHRPADPDPYHGLEANLLGASGTTTLFRSRAHVEQARPTDYEIRVNTEAGSTRESVWVEAHALPAPA